MILLLDIGNTNTHLGLGDSSRVRGQMNIPSNSWLQAKAAGQIRKFVGNSPLQGAILCSVVPDATSIAIRTIEQIWNMRCLELTPKTVTGVGIDYPKPRSIGPDRLANAVAVRRHFGAPAVVVDFGTAVTFDVVNRAGNYVGGIIAPGLAAMTDYLHEKTALLPRIRIHETKSVIGKSTEEAMNIGALHGYRGLIRALLLEVKAELGTKRLPVVGTGGYAKIMAARLPEITAVEPLLTLEGIRLVWHDTHSSEHSSASK